MVLEEYKNYFTDVYETDSLTAAVCNAEANRVQLSDMPHGQETAKRRSSGDARTA